MPLGNVFEEFLRVAVQLEVVPVAVLRGPTELLGNIGPSRPAPVNTIVSVEDAAVAESLLQEYERLVEPLDEPEHREARAEIFLGMLEHPVGDVIERLG